MRREKIENRISISFCRIQQDCFRLSILSAGKNRYLQETKKIVIRKKLSAGIPANNVFPADNEFPANNSCE